MKCVDVPAVTMETPAGGSYLLCVSQLLEVGQRGALSLAGGVGLTEIHLVLSLRRAQVEHSSCVD